MVIKRWCWRGCALLQLEDVSRNADSMAWSRISSQILEDNKVNATHLYCDDPQSSDQSVGRLFVSGRGDLVVMII